IDLTKPFDPIKSLPKAPGGAKDAKVEKVEDGKETIKVGDKKYECTWMKLKSTGKVQGQDVTSDVKMWLSKDVGLAGLVKVEVKSDVAEATMTFADQGKGK